MQISEFSRISGLSKDTIRFYVRKGLLSAQLGQKGARHPYQIFDEVQVQRARLIRIAQSLGFTLREIAAISEAFRAKMEPPQEIALIGEHVAALDRKMAQIREVQAYLSAKIDWLKHGATSPAPAFRGEICEMA